MYIGLSEKVRSDWMYQISQVSLPWVGLVLVSYVYHFLFIQINVPYLFFFFALETAKISHPQLSWQFPSGYRTRAWHPLVEREKKSKAGHLPYLVTEFKLWLYHHCSDEGLSFSRNKLPLESNLNQCLWKTYNPGYWWCCYRTIFFACGSRIVPLKLASDNS